MAAPAAGLIEAAKGAGAVLAAVSGLSYASGYLALRARARALGTDPGFELVDEAYIFAGFRFAMITLIALLVAAPLLIGLRAAAGGVRAALGPVALAAAEFVAAAVVALTSLSLLAATLGIKDALLEPASAGASDHMLREAALGLNNWVGVLMTVVSAALAACTILWLWARLATAGTDSLALILAATAALQLALLPLQHGVFYADRNARRLERAPDGLPNDVVASSVWLIGSGHDRAVLLAHDAKGQPRLITVKANKLDGIAVTETGSLGAAVESGRRR